MFEVCGAGADCTGDGVPAKLVEPTANALRDNDRLADQWHERADGRLQVTYKHHPLYLFANDTKKGQTNGEELDTFGAEWYALSPAGARIAEAATTGSGSGGYGNGYGY